MRIPERRKDKDRRRIVDALPVLELFSKGVTKIDAIFLALERDGKSKPKWYIRHVLRATTAALIVR